MYDEVSHAFYWQNNPDVVSTGISERSGSHKMCYSSIWEGEREIFSQKRERGAHRLSIQHLMSSPFFISRQGESQNLVKRMEPVSGPTPSSSSSLSSSCSFLSIPAKKRVNISVCGCKNLLLLRYFHDFQWLTASFFFETREKMHEAASCL